MRAGKRRLEKSPAPVGVRGKARSRRTTTEGGRPRVLACWRRAQREEATDGLEQCKHVGAPDHYVRSLGVRDGLDFGFFDG